MVAYETDEHEPPLDPAAERLRRKMTRLLLASGGLMVLGFIAVFAALVYKLGFLGEAGGHSRTQAPAEAQVAVPAGARLVAADLDGERALLRMDLANGGVLLILLDLGSGATVGRYELRSE
jgi:hypothetical protein